MKDSFLSILIISLSLCGCLDKVEDRKEKPGRLSQIYVNSEKGDDSFPGSKRKPVRTITEVNKRLESGLSDVLFEGGKEYEGTLVLTNLRQPDTSPLIIGSCGDGIAVINGGNAEAIRINDCKNVRIVNLDLRGNGRKEGNITNGLSIIKSVGCKVKNVSAGGFQKSGVDLYDCMDIELSGVTTMDNGFSGINVMGSSQDSSRRILIKDCRSDNNPGDPTRLDNHSGNGILVGVSGNVIIDHCTATNNGWDMPREGNGPVGIWAWMSDSVVIQYCISYRNRTSKGGKDGGGFDLDGGVTNSVVQYCLSYENEGAGYGLFQYPGAADWSGNIVRFNVSINDAKTTEGSGGIFIWNGSRVKPQLRDCYIYNNVIYTDLAPVISYESASGHDNFIFSNNIFIGAGKFIAGKNTGSSFSGNIWWSINSGECVFEGFGSFDDWAESTFRESDRDTPEDAWIEPALDGPFITDITNPYELSRLTGYMLKPGSPLLTMAGEIQKFRGYDPPEHDFYGNLLPSSGLLVPGIHQYYPKE